jgi:hypothetical protein
MEDHASLRQTLTHLFDAVRHGRNFRDLADSAKAIENRLQDQLTRLEVNSGELYSLLASMKRDPEEPIRLLGQQVEAFLQTAKQQARSKLENAASGELRQARASMSSEKDKAVKSLEAYLATSPLPLTDSTTALRFDDKTYVAQADFECEGGLTYEFGLATQNSKYFHGEFMLSQFGSELKVPVRFGRTLLKGRVPGFERLDQYLLTNAELSNGKLRASFQKMGGDATFKVVMSGFGKDDFCGIEYVDPGGTVNIMTDLSLMVHVDIDSLKAAMSRLASELNAVAGMKVTLLRSSLDGEDLLETLDCYKLLEMVMRVLGPKYRTLLEKLPEKQISGKSGEELSLMFVKERLRLLGDFSKPVSQLLGVKDLGLYSSG